MAHVLLTVASVAFCVWLTVRIVSRRERWAKWTLAAVACLPVLYLASFGPACWVVSRTNRGALPLSVLYGPIAQIMWWTDTESVLGSAINRYSKLGAAPDWAWMRVDL